MANLLTINKNEVRWAMFKVLEREPTKAELNKAYNIASSVLKEHASDLLTEIVENIKEAC